MVNDPQVRIVHASPDAPAVDVGPSTAGTVSAVPDFTNLPFTVASTELGTVLPSGSITVGVAANPGTAAVAEFDLVLTGGLRAFGNAVGTLGSDGESFRLVIVDTSVWPWISAEVMPNP